MEELCNLGTDPKYVCWKPQKGSSGESPHPAPRVANEAGSSDEEEEDEEEASTSSHPQREDASVDPNTAVNSEKTPIALVDYILNVVSSLLLEGFRFTFNSKLVLVLTLLVPMSDFSDIGCMQKGPTSN